MFQRIRRLLNVLWPQPVELTSAQAWLSVHSQIYNGGGQIIPAPQDMLESFAKATLPPYDSESFPRVAHSMVILLCREVLELRAQRDALIKLRDTEDWFAKYDKEHA